MQVKVAITFDFELGWGAIENGVWRVRESRGVYDNLRAIIPKILRLLTEYEIPITWATVAGMIDPNVRDNLEHLPGQIRETTMDSLKHGRESTFDARDLIDLVLATRYQKLASHSYSHVRFTHPGVNEHFIKSEMALCADVWKQKGQDVDTFVFPQNQEGFYGVLSNHGIVKARGAEKTSQPRSLIGRVWDNLSRPPPVSYSKMKNGVELQTGSLLYKASPGMEVRLPLLDWQLSRGLSSASATGGTFHIYNHPFNLSESERMYNAYKKMLIRLVGKRDRGELEFLIF